MSTKTAVLAGVGLLLMLLAGPMAIQVGQNHEYTVESKEQLDNELTATDLPPEARSLIDGGRDASGAVVVAPSSYDTENGSTDRRAYPASLPEAPRPDADVDPPPTEFVVHDDGRYLVATVALNETAVGGGLDYRLDVTVADRTDAIVHREALSTEAQAVIDRAQSVNGKVEVYSDLPSEFRQNGYTPQRGPLDGFFTDTHEHVVVEDDSTAVVRVVEIGDAFDLSGVFTPVFVLGALLTIPALTGVLQEATRPTVAVVGAVAFVLVAVVFVRVIARPPPLGDPLKPLQASEQIGTVLLSGTAAVIVAGAAVSLQSSANQQDRGDDA